MLRFLSDFSRPFNGGGEDFGDDDDGDDDDEVRNPDCNSATLHFCTKDSATPQRSKVAKPSTEASLIFFK